MLHLILIMFIFFYTRIRSYSNSDRKYGELLDMFIECNGDWAQCQIVQTLENQHRRKVSGENRYRMYKEIKALHGEEDAKALRDSKKLKQATQGDMLPGVPFWYSHPDWPESAEHELFLCFEEARVNSSSEDVNATQQRINLQLDGALAQELRCLATGEAFYTFSLHSF